MKRLLPIWFMIVGYCAVCSAQDPAFYISGVIHDSETSVPLKNVTVSVEGSFGQTKSNSTGYFRIAIKKFPVTIKFTHVAYQEKSIEISNSKTASLLVEMETRYANLKEVSIIPEVPVNIIYNKPLYVKDYDFFENKIVMLVYRNKHISNPELMVMNMNGDSLTGADIPRPEKLYKDCMGNIHLIAQNEAWQLFLDSTKVQFLYSAPSEDYEQVLSPCVESFDEKYFLRNYFYNSQVLDYFYYPDSRSKPQEFRTIADESALRRLKDKSRLMSMVGYTEDDERFEQMCFYAPIFAPLVRIKDSIIIFNFVESKIEYFSDEAKPLKETSISFHKNKDWKKEIFVDDACGKVYTLFKHNGSSTLREIDLNTGELKYSIPIPDFIFVEKIKIHNGKVYFLYTEKNFNDEYKQLYSLKI